MSMAELYHKPTFATKPILVVDDHGPGRELLVRRLEAAGHTATPAGDGARAIAIAERTPFDLILMDVHMPVLNGLDVARRIRAGSGPNRAAPIVAMTADDTVLNACLDADMNDFIRKPLTPNALSGVIHRWLEPTEPRDPNG